MVGWVLVGSSTPTARRLRARRSLPQRFVTLRLGWLRRRRCGCRLQHSVTYRRGTGDQTCICTAQELLSAFTLTMLNQSDMSAENTGDAAILMLTPAEMARSLMAQQQPMGQQ